MTETEFLRVGIRLNTIWPDAFPPELLAEWRELLRHRAEDVHAAIDEHHQTIAFPPRLAEILGHVRRRRGETDAGRASTRTSAYLRELAAAGEEAERQVRRFRERVEALADAGPIEARAVECLAERFPALAGHYRTRGRLSPLVLMEMARLVSAVQEVNDG